MNKIGIILLLGLFGFANCGNYSPPRAMADYNCAKDGIDNSSLIGTWVPDRETLEYLKARGNHNSAASAKLSVRKDASLEASGIPMDEVGEPISGSGKWDVVPLDKECFGLEIKIGAASAKLEILKKSEERVYILRWYLGGRDKNKMMVFVKAG
jgi:hypothetical protein